MATDKQIAVNRLNAQKCTGPRTPEGKAISSQNALKTGIDAVSEVIRCESRAEYEQLIAEFYRRFRPTEPEDRGLVDLLIKSEWLSRRYASVEASVWECGFNAVASKTLDRVFGLSADSFDRLDRRINSAQRNYQRALKQLLEIRTKRVTAPSDEPAATLTEQSTPLIEEPVPQNGQTQNPGAEEPSSTTPEPSENPIVAKELNPSLSPKLVSFLTGGSTRAPLTAEDLDKEGYPPVAA